MTIALSRSNGTTSVPLPPLRSRVDGLANVARSVTDPVSESTLPLMASTVPCPSYSVPSLMRRPTLGSVDMARSSEPWSAMRRCISASVTEK